MNQKLRWGILGTGNIAKKFAQGVADSASGELVAVGSRSVESAQAFASKFPVNTAHGSYEALLADPDVEAVYISTPHPLHAEWAVKTAEAGKHILCEKPLTMNHAEAMAVAEAAHRHGVFLMEAFMYRCHPQTARVVELVRTGAIGEVRLIRADFGFDAGRNLSSRLLDPALGGGGILDVGCYCASMARLVAGAAHGTPFEDPVKVHAEGHIGAETGVDEWTVATLTFSRGLVAQLATAVQLSLPNEVRIFASAGHIHIPSPWIVMKGTEPSVIHLHRRGAEPEEIVIEPERSLYALEADEVAAHIAAGESPAMPIADTLGNMRTLDQWRAAMGLTYESERSLPPRQIARRAEHTMRYGRIEGLEKDVSRIFMGCDNQASLPHAAAMFDDWIERGGTAFDTAWVYGGGRHERLLGEWVKSRGMREQVVILGKGAHTPHCNPEALTRQLHESLDRLQTDYVDLYMMHRDNEEIPVGEFIEVLNEHQRAGRMRAFGGSNWSLERVAAANDYAAQHGLTGFAAISNNLGLAHMVDPVWAGCMHVSDAASRAWLTERQMPVLAWSSQARGFFTERGDPGDTSDAEMVRCWHSAENFARRERAIEMARAKGVLPINIALAYVLCQPFPTYALIGPRVLEETRTSLPGLEIELTLQELEWLAE